MAPVPDGKRAFYSVLINTFIANMTTSFLWFALTFWIYLETRSVLATALLGGSYILLLAVMAVPFGALVDRHPKKRVMVGAQLVTAAAFAAAFALYLAVPQAQILTVGSPALSRTTCRPFLAWRTISASISACGVDSPKPSLPASMMSASRRARSRIAGVTSRSWITTSAASNARRARTVSRSGSPGPEPTKSTCPLFGAAVRWSARSCASAGATASSPPLA